MRITHQETNITLLTPEYFGRYIHKNVAAININLLTTATYIPSSMILMLSLKLYLLASFATFYGTT